MTAHGKSGDIPTDAFEQEVIELCLQHSIVGCILGLILMPAGFMLDYFVYRNHLGYFFQARIVVDFIITIILAFHFIERGRRYGKFLAMSWVLLFNFSFCWMIYVTDGALSSYYAALNMILLAASLLLPWSLPETLFASIMTIGMYFAACYLHGGVDGVTNNWSIFFNNVYFILLTSILCCASNYFSAKARFQNFLLRHELDDSVKKLKNLDRLKSHFFANISHELRTPLTLILTPVEKVLAKNDEFADSIYKDMLTVHNNALRLLKLINELLDVMRLEEKRMILSEKTIDLSGFVPGIVDSIKHLANAKDLKMTTEKPTEQVLVSGDPNSLEKILLNLLSNAIKFTNRKGQISVRIYKKGENAVIDVSDTGIGIEEKDLSLIFDRFQQIDGSETRAYQGVGIGLSLARGLIEEHGGALTVKSEKGKGTTFSVFLPQTRVDTGQIVSSPIDAETSNEPFGAAFKSAERQFVLGHEQGDLPVVGSGEHTVLVVDDEPDMLRFLVSIVSEKYRVLQASDGEKALELVEKERPDLILLDWMLPGKSGLELCRILRANENNKNIKIILLTARVDEASKIRALKEGADDFLTKPFSSVELQSRIANFIHTASLQSELKTRNSELVTALAKLQETEAQLVQSEKMNSLGVLSAGLLHEINNPLNITLAAIDFAHDLIDENDNEIKEALDDIEEEMKRIKNIVTDLRTFAYPEKAGNMNVFSLFDAFASSMHLAAAELKGITIENELNPEIEIWGSQTQLVHVMINLLVNAGKALKNREKPLIRLSGEQVDDRYRISVYDNGMGIKKEYIDRIFDPFFTTREVGQGTGLGLSICHTIIANHGGKLRAKSQENEWTEISFDLSISNSDIIRR